MMNAQVTIPLSAKRSDTFTPPSLKPQPVLVADAEAEGGQRETGEFTGGDRELGFVIRIPTPSERDTIGTRLFELGLTSVSQETIRATMIDELYKLDWGKGEEGNEAHADELAEFLDGYWTRQSIDEHATQLWMEQEAQRLLDAANGVEKPALEQPVKSIKVREHAKAKLLIDDVMERSQRLRGLVSKQMDYGRLNAQLMARLHLMALVPADPAKLPADVSLERGPDGLITVASIDALREYIGPEAWSELVDRIDNHYSLAETERKNSVSPPGKPSDQTGSPEQSGDSGNSDGRSTDSSIGHAPTGVSETITGKSSASSSGSGGKKRKAGQTGEG